MLCKNTKIAVYTQICTGCKGQNSFHFSDSETRIRHAKEQAEFREMERRGKNSHSRKHAHEGNCSIK